MKLKIKADIVLLAVTLFIISFAGCGKTNPTPSETPIPSPSLSPVLPSPTLPAVIPTTSPTASPDAMTTASIVNTADAFEKAIGPKGTWIVCLLNDLTVNKDLVLDGEFKNGKKDSAGKDIIQRKLALYTQDENNRITNRFTLTAPKLTINSPNASIQYGTFKGDLYVAAKNFQLVDSKIDGNVYFTNNDAKSTFKMDGISKITGKQELKQ